MAEVLLLSDNTSAGYFGMSRYVGPYALASSLEANGTSVVVIDYISRCANLFQIIESNIDENTLFIGISTTFMTPISSVVNFSRTSSERIDSAYNYITGPILFEKEIALNEWLLKIRNLLNRKCPNAKIVIGGAKLQFLFERPELYKCIDYLVIGAADIALIDLATSLREKKSPHYTEYIGRKVISQSALQKSKTECPKTNWNKSWGIQKHEALPIEISRGCIFNCKFCHYDKKESLRKRLEDLRSELIYNYETFGTRFYHFCDDCFNDHPDKVRTVCQALIDLPFQIEWISYARVDVAVKYPDTVDLMIRSGAKGLFWGIESFNYDVARAAGKGTPSDKVKKFLKDFYMNYGDQCTSSGSFIVGLPGETQDTQIETIDWVINEKALHFIDVMPLKLRPYYQSLDKLMTDYADYSRNPKKYGFEEIGFNPAYWRHSTMDSNKAYELTQKFNSNWRTSDSTRRGLIYSIWTYPHLRSLGYTHEEVREIHTSEIKKDFYAKDIIEKFRARLNSYYNQLNAKPKYTELTHDSGVLENEESEAASTNC